MTRFPNHSATCLPFARSRCRGFSIISAIFILVVLAALGAFVVNISTNQQIGATLDVQGVRAYQAARAGIEWGIYQLEATPAYNFGYASPNPNLRACPAATSFVPAASTLAGFTVTLRCAATSDVSGGPTVYSFTAFACNQPAAGACPNTAPTGNNYIERRIDVTL